jgi:hypothetical protein
MRRGFSAPLSTLLNRREHSFSLLGIPIAGSDPETEFRHEYKGRVDDAKGKVKGAVEEAKQAVKRAVRNR